MAWRILLLGGDSKQQRALAEKIRARFPDARLTYQPNMAAWPEPRVRDKFDIILAGPSIDWSQLESLLSGLKENDDATPLVVFSRNPQGMVSSHSEASLRHPKAQQEMLGKIITNLLEDRSSTSSSEGEHFEAHRQFWVDRAGRVHGQLSILNLWPNARGQEDEPPQWEKMFPQISLQQIKKQLAATTSEGDVNYRFVIRAANGQSFLVTLCPNTSLDSADGQILFWGEIEELPSISLPVENPIESEEHETQPLFTQEWESVLGFLGIGIAVVDDEFRVLWANQAWWQILQVSQVPSPGVSLFQTIQNSTPWTSESIAAFQKQLASLGRETFVLEVQLCESATGWEHWLKLKQTSLSEDRKVLFFQDLTAEKKAHQELEVLAQALRSTTECISITDLDNRIIFVNDAFIRVYGYAREELIGQSVSRLRPEGFSEEKDRQILEATLRGGWQGEVMNRRKDGSVFPVFLSTSAVRDSRGQIVALIGVARDISERKAQEAALRESQSQLRSLLDKAPEAIILYEIGTDRFKDANPQAFKLFGYSPERFFECSLLDLCPQYQPNGRLSSELIEEYLTRARQGEDPSFEWVHVTADKKPIWCEVHLTYFVANNQEYVRGTILDISERKRIEKELRQSEAKFRSFFENSLDIVFTTDARGHIVDINAAVETVLGYKPAELRGSSLFQLAADPHAAQRVVEKLLQQGYVRAQEVRGWSRDGSVKIGLLSATVLRNENGRLAGVQGIVQDITERKAQEEEIYRLATVVQQSKEGVIITDEKGFVIYANPAFQKLTGQTRGSVLGLPFRRVFSGMGSEQLKTVWDLLKKRKYWQGTLVQTKKDGTETHRFISAFPIEDSYGRVINYAFIVRDLTKEKQLEHQLQQMQRLEAIGQMAGSIAHDFNNLLSLILGYAELIQSTYGHIPGLEKDVERIIEATESGARLTDQLLAFGRRQMIQPKLLDLSEYIAGLQNMLRRLLEDTIALEFQLLPHLPPVLADEGQIQQILLNLIINARDAILERPLSERPARIVVRTSSCEVLAPDPRFPIQLKPGTYIRLEVEDTGIGIAPDIQERIFEPFFTTKEKGKGTGLGLSSVFGILQQNQAGIEVHSRPGVGTTFVVLWPVREKASAKTAVPSIETPASHSRPARKTILYVEDEPHIRQLIAEGLRQAGYRVLVAGDGQEAIERFGEEAIDILFTDVLMPRMDGQELAQRLKAKNPELVILFASGYAPSVFLNDQKVQLLRKPFSVKDVLRKLERLS